MGFYSVFSVLFCFFPIFPFYFFLSLSVLFLCILFNQFLFHVMVEVSAP